MIFPAIDLQDGRSVRLYKGDFAQKTVINPDPVDQAKQYEAAKVGALHLVDLDGAKAGKPDRKSTRLNSSHVLPSRMPSSA